MSDFLLHSIFREIIVELIYLYRKTFGFSTVCPFSISSQTSGGLKVFNSVVLDDPRKILSIFRISRGFRVSSQQEYGQ
jgi:hypothetical protein